jgi:hypothetical protein
MSVVISGSLVLGDSQSGGGTINANNPIIGYQNLVTASNVSSTSSEAGFPATNLANPSTYLKWVGVVSDPVQDEYITLQLNTNEDVDYVGIAGHNFYTAQIAVSIEIVDESGSPTVWEELTSPVIPPNDGPLLFRFTPQGVVSIRIRMQPGNAAPQAAVVYSGALLVIQRRLYVGHTPITLGRKTKVTNGRSESGKFLGRIVLSEMTATKVDLQNLTPSWYRTYMDPFVLNSQEYPFFFAWRPSAYPNEVGYAWLTSDPNPTNQSPNGMMQVSLEMSGIRQ